MLWLLTGSTSWRLKWPLLPFQCKRRAAAYSRTAHLTWLAAHPGVRGEGLKPLLTHALEHLSRSFTPSQRLLLHCCGNPLQARSNVSKYPVVFPLKLQCCFLIIAKMISIDISTLTWWLRHCWVWIAEKNCCIYFRTYVKLGDACLGLSTEGAGASTGAAGTGSSGETMPKDNVAAGDSASICSASEITLEVGGVMWREGVGAVAVAGTCGVGLLLQYIYNR